MTNNSLNKRISKIKRNVTSTNTSKSTSKSTNRPQFTRKPVMELLSFEDFNKRVKPSEEE